MEDECLTLLDRFIPYNKVVKIKVRVVFPPIPHHRFFLQDYNRLCPPINKLDILTDVIGHIVAVQHLELIKINQRIDHKCDLVIQNIRLFLLKEEAKLTLWSNITHNFSSVSLEALPQPIVAVFTGSRLKLFANNIILNNTESTLFFIDPDTPELNLYKSIFSNWPHPIRTLPPSNQANETDILQTGKRVTIEQLGYLDPDLYKDDTFLCKASMKRFNTRYEYVLIIGKSGEKVPRTSCNNLVFNQRSVDQK
ncbi:replication protein A 70 kDa DNA-binding subunit C-like [Pyrus ussuriensis x Pyrus communis]|uniref:Replication protein A 70 kDa DNA-binding subunit C-like n=1 Tax=Pyrus ussuriensis x Pyrus communis TaxID=2448454 RepID=A0A5N5EW91_9ROSA|nr:replication protein A 70 kDa DNA-binding subunit C-like [Pyrus ussuriensis x Pyrus communis]